jgi:HD-GYP domain-containing protein (c-di-GMP phosphodiesterase class II)
VADAYSAMTTDRPYRAGLPLEIALGELTRGSGSQFDPEVVRVFLTCFDIKPSAQPEEQRREGIRGVAVVVSSK